MRRKMNNNEKTKNSKSTIVGIIICTIILLLCLGVAVYFLWQQRVTAMAEVSETNANIKSNLVEMEEQLGIIEETVNISKESINNVDTNITKQDDSISTSFNDLHQNINTTVNNITVDTSELSKQITETKAALALTMEVINETQNADSLNKYTAIIEKLNNVNSEVNTLQEDSKKQYEDVTKNIKTFSDKLDEYLKETDETERAYIEECFDTLNTNVDDSTSSITTDINDLSTQLLNSTQDIIDFVEQTHEGQLEDFQAGYDNLNESLTTLETNFDALETAMTEQSIATQNQLTEFQVALTNHINEFDTNLNNTLTTNFEAINQAIEGSKTEILGSLDDISSDVSSAKTEITDLLNTLNENELADIQDRFDNLQTTLTNITIHFDTTLNDINTLIVNLSLQNAEEYNATITKLTSVQDNLINVNSTNKASLVNSLTAMQNDYAELIGNLSNNISLSFTNLGNQVEQCNERLSNKMDTMSQTLTSNVDTNIANQNNIIASQFEGLNGQLTTNGTNFDTKFNNINLTLEQQYELLAQNNYDNDQEILALLTQYQTELNIYHQQLDENFQCVAIGKQKLVTAIATQSEALSRAGLTVTSDMSFIELVDTLKALDKAIFYDEQGGCKFTEYTIEKAEEAPTCDTPGYYHKITYCTYCKTVSNDEKIEVPALGHDYHDTIIKATCEHAGYTEHVCSRCGDRSIINEVPAVEHKWSTGRVIKTATCLESGSTAYTCEYCGRTKIEDIAALGHDYNNVVTNPTCVKQGYTTHTCSRCGDSYVDSYTNALGHHNVISIQNNISPSPSSRGSYDVVTKCDRCNNILESVHHVVNAIPMYEVKHVHTDSCYVLVPEIIDEVCIHQCLPYTPYHKTDGILRNWNEDWVVFIQAKGSSSHCQMHENGIFNEHTNVSIFVNGAPDRIENPIIMSGSWSIDPSTGGLSPDGRLENRMTTVATYSSPSTFDQDMNNPSNFSSRTISHVESYTEMVPRIGCGYSENDVEVNVSMSRVTTGVNKATLSINSSVSNSTYSWNTGSTSQSIEVTSNGTYTCTITYTNPVSGAVQSTTLSYTIDDF